MNPWKGTTAVLFITTIAGATGTAWFYIQRNMALNGYSYLVKKLAENDIELEEFDIIALKNMSDKSPLRKKKTEND